jgi:hypothetical protein
MFPGRRVDEEAELGPRREAEAHRPRQKAARRREHEELTRNPGFEPAALEAEKPVRADLLDSDDVKQFSSQLAPEVRRRLRFARARSLRRSEGAGEVVMQGCGRRAPPRG